MKTERLDTRTRQGRRVAVWRSVADAPDAHAPIIVLNAGFARRMRDVGSIALCLVRNGAVVYRFDSVDHLGLSDGEIVDFTLSGIMDSLRATIELARLIESRRTVRVVALSLANLAAYRLAVEDHGIERIMAISGVVHGAATLEKVIGYDYTDMRYEKLPERVTVFDHEVDPRPLWTDNQRSGCLRLDTVVDQLDRISASVANCVAADDPWVDIDECDRVFTSAGSGDRMIIKLPYSGHDLGRNPVAITTILQRMGRLALGTGSLRDAESVSVDLPGFDELLELRITERDREKCEQLAAAHEGNSAR